MTNLDMRNMPDHYPRSRDGGDVDDQVLAWLIDRAADPLRDAAEIDALIGEYEKAAEDMISLEQVVNGLPTVQDWAQKKRKKEPKP